MLRYLKYLLTSVPIQLNIATQLVSVVVNDLFTTTELKGNSVKNRNYPRSCKLILKALAISVTVPTFWSGKTAKVE